MGSDARIQPESKNLPESRILIVEDDAIMQRVLAEFARSAGHDFVIAGTGAEGLILAESEPFMLILTEFSMTRLNGLEMIEAIRDSRGPNAKTPAVVITTRDRESIYKRARCVGAADVLTKPVSYDAFCSAVALYAERASTEDTDTAPRLDA